ncbi:hypothetical protein GGI42DRAFT_336961, partial [Trichoderma sp. SZMC 28013]
MAERNFFLFFDIGCFFFVLCAANSSRPLSLLTFPGSGDSRQSWKLRRTVYWYTASLFFFVILRNVSFLHIISKDL